MSELLCQAHARRGRARVGGREVDAALNVLRLHLREDAARLEALRRAVAAGVADLESGRFEMLVGAAEVDAFLDAIDREPKPDSPAAQPGSPLRRLPAGISAKPSPEN